MPFLWPFFLNNNKHIPLIRVESMFISEIAIERDDKHSCLFILKYYNHNGKINSLFGCLSEISMFASPLNHFQFAYRLVSHKSTWRGAKIWKRMYIFTTPKKNGVSRLPYICRRYSHNAAAWNNATHDSTSSLIISRSNFTPNSNAQTLEMALKTCYFEWAFLLVSSDPLPNRSIFFL